ncbi:hypothetical protein FACS1894205_2560 [Alphaproteobacteria bacterium]|nr:hypothetical protein FACS1894205_2560 [Alphaproteobacteria bacterium]
MVMDMKRDLGLRIRSFRRIRSLTQEQLAEAIERTPEAVSNIERGQSLPSLETLERMAAFLGIPLSDFFEKTGAPLNSRRTEQEVRLCALAKHLSDDDLEISLRQTEVLLDVRSRRTKQ